MLGWYILVRKRTFGGAIGYSSGRNNSSLKTPSTRACRVQTDVSQERARRTLEWTPVWTLDGHIKVPEIVLVWGSGYSRCGVCYQTLRLLIGVDKDAQRGGSHERYINIPLLCAITVNGLGSERKGQTRPDAPLEGPWTMKLQ